MMKWTDRSPEERHAILNAPFPVVRYCGKSYAGHQGGPRFQEDRQNELAHDEGTKLSIYSIMWEWAFHKSDHQF